MGWNILGRIYAAHCSVQTWGFVTVKVEVKVKFTLEQATKARSWSNGIALLFL